MPDKNPLELADEDFLKLGGPPPVTEAPKQDDPPAGGEGGDPPAGDAVDTQDPPAGDPTNDGGDGDGDPDPAAGDDLEKDKDKGDGGAGGDGAAPKAGDPPKDGGTLPQDKSQGQDPKDKRPPTGDAKPNGDGAAPAGSDASKSTDTPPDYKTFFEKVTAPLRANGKTIELKTPEEAIQLMQMGANYTRKMQQLAPHRKLLMMLETNQLLDEDKLSFLIDIEKKNPEAIKKLIKEAGIDPRDIDLDDPNAKPYLQGNHRVSDAEANIRTILDDLSSNPEGKATLQAIQGTWDQASKEELWKQPDLMQVIHEQRQQGLYDRIAAEVDRQRTMGSIPANVPFVYAYKAIGDQMSASGQLDDILKPQSKIEEPVKKPDPVITRTDKPKSDVKSGDRANAASTSRSNPRAAETKVNPFSLPDDEFMKQVAEFQGRL